MSQVFPASSALHLWQPLYPQSLHVEFVLGPSPCTKWQNPNACDCSMQLKKRNKLKKHDMWMSNENPIWIESELLNTPMVLSYAQSQTHLGNRGNLVSGKHGAEFSIAVVLQQFSFLAGEMRWRAEGDHAAAAPWHGKGESTNHICWGFTKKNGVIMRII